MMAFWLILLIVALVVIWVLFRGRPGGGAAAASDPAEQALREQYARGEIDEETYRRRLDELRRR